MMSAMIQKLHVIAAAAVLALGVAGGVQAATVGLLGTSTNGGGNMADVFAAGYGAFTPSGATWSSDPTVTPPPGNLSKVYASPFSTTSLEATRPYFSVGAESGLNGALSPVSLMFKSAQTSIKLLWGSIDSYNTIKFFSGVNSVYSLTGTQLVNLFSLPGSAENYGQVALLSFTKFGTAGFDKIEFISTKAAFEFALAEPAPIPVPAAGLLLLTALGGISLLRRGKTA